MALSMHALSVPVFCRSLGNLSLILGKAEAYALERKIEPAVLLNARLFPDMFPLLKQVQVACDFAKGATARLAGEEPPRFPDDETGFADLRERLARTIAYCDGVAPARFDGAETRMVEMKLRDGVHEWNGLVYLTQVALPNFYFHVVTAYGILRHAGVALGKRDYVGLP